MSSSYDRTNTADVATTNYLRAYAHELVHLPGPDAGTWEWRDLNYAIATNPRTLEEHNVIEHVDTRYETTPGNEYTRNVYRTNADVYAVIEDIAEHANRLPCGHTGFHTVDTTGQGEYECTTCDATYPRSVIEEVFGE